MYLFQNQMVRLWKPLLSSSHLLYQYVPHSFHFDLWIPSSDFYIRTGHYSHFWTILPTSCFVKTSRLVFARCQLLHFNMRSLIWFTLATFPKFTCYIFALLYFYSTFFPPWLLNSLASRTHGYTHSHYHDLFPYRLLIDSIIIHDSYRLRLIAYLYKPVVTICVW